MTDDTVVSSRGSSWAITVLIISLNVKIPTSFPSSTTKAAFLLSAIFMPASRTVVSGHTIVLGWPFKRLPREGDVLFPKAFDINGPRTACRVAAAFVFWTPWDATTSIRASCTALEVLDWAFSNFLIASLKHLAMSNKPTTLPFSSVTGRCLKLLDTIVARASIAESSMEQDAGLGVAISETVVNEASICLATIRLVMSVSVTMPASWPSSSTTKDADPRFAANIFETARTVSLEEDTSGFFGRNFDTGRTFSCLLIDGAFDRFSLTVDPATVLPFPLLNDASSE